MFIVLDIRTDYRVPHFKCVRVLNRSHLSDEEKALIVAEFQTIEQALEYIETHT